MSRHTRVLLAAASLLSSSSFGIGAETGGGPDGAVGSSRSAGEAADRASVILAHEALVHAAVLEGGGYRSQNPGQRWTTDFDGRGFTATPDQGTWSWGLELQSYGWPGAQQTTQKAARVTAEGGRVAYEWGDEITEWYVNDRRGLEHGYTVSARPASAKGRLTLHLAIRGGLAPVISADGRDVRFVDADGAAAVSYLGLTVFDAEGTSCAARFEPTTNGLRLAICDEVARYPLTIDPIAKQAYLKASNTGAGDRFGWSVGISGDTAVVGAFGEDSNATGVNGNETNDAATDSGAAYVFVRSGFTWVQQAYLKASNTGPGDYFGLSVAIDGDTIVVGALREDSNATGINGNGSDDSAVDAGAAYVFVRNGTTWTQQAYLKASNTDPGDQFGGAVSISGDTIVVGASRESGGATGVNGPGNDNSKPTSGAAYVFVRSGSSWTLQAYMKAATTDANDVFGYSVSISGDSLVVGALFEAGGATTVNGDTFNNSAFAAGAAYVFVRSGSNWSQQAYLKAFNSGTFDFFGRSSSIDGNTIVVGANGEGSSATGVNGAGFNNDAAGSGAAYVFTRSGTTWSQQAYLKAFNSEASDYFGGSVSISGDSVVVGCEGEDSGTTGVNGDGGNNLVLESGAAHVFVRNGAQWTQQAYLKASNTGKDDTFGHSVAVVGETVLVGSVFEGSNATGVNGNEFNNAAAQSGAVYVYSVPCAGSIVSFGAGCAGSGGFVPSLNVVGCATGLGTLDLEITGGIGGSSALLLVGVTTAALPIGGGCTLLVGPAPLLIVAGLPLGGAGPGAGALQLPAVLPASIPAATVALQAAILAAGSPIGFSMTQGTQLNIQ